MNDPAPAFGRGGWVCAALLVGLFAGGGITWAVLAHRPVKPPLIVYQLPPTPGESPATPAGEIHEHEPSLRGNLRRDEAMELAASTGEEAPGSLRLPELRLRNDLILQNHPKAEGCFTNALAAIAPFVKQRFDLRDKVWEGEISLDEGKAVSCQLFKGNDYCFAVGTDAKGARLSLQLYDRDGLPTEAERTTQASPAGANATAWLRCRQTGTYFVIVKLEAATQEKVPWGMVSAYR